MSDLFYDLFITDAMAATLPLPGTSGRQTALSPEAFMTPMLVSSLCRMHTSGVVCIVACL